MTSSDAAGKLVFLFDGVCGLCHGFVQFLIRHDAHDRFRFAALQGELAASTLARHGKSVTDMDTVYTVENLGTPQELLRLRSSAALHAMGQLGGVFAVLVRPLMWLPEPLRDWGYTQVAQRRYRLFGKHAACPIPSTAQRAKFIG